MNQIRRLHGWTLLELILVIFLCSLIGLGFFSTKFNLNDYKERLADDKLMSQLRYVQKLSMSKGCDTLFEMSPTKTTIVQLKPCDYKKNLDFVNHLNLSKIYLFKANGSVQLDNEKKEEIIKTRNGSIHIISRTGLIYAD